MIYFTADLHFHHQNIIAHSKRPFSSVEEMDRVLVENWNRRVAPQDEIYILGDLTLEGAAQAAELLRQLNGQKYLIRGNHDRFTQQAGFLPEQFVWVGDYYELCPDQRWLILCHYPFLEWNHCCHGAIHLHGHQHNRPIDNQWSRAAGLLRYDVGVDANGFAPVSLPEILAFFEIGEDNQSPWERNGESHGTGSPASRCCLATAWRSPFAAGKPEDPGAWPASSTRFLRAATTSGRLGNCTPRRNSPGSPLPSAIFSCRTGGGCGRIPYNPAPGWGAARPGPGECPPCL